MEYQHQKWIKTIQLFNQSISEIKAISHILFQKFFNNSGSLLLKC